MSQTFREAIKHGSDCPPLEFLIEVMQSHAPGSEGVAEHAKNCLACQTELALFREFEAGEIRPDERDAVEFIVRRLKAESASAVARKQTPVSSFWPMIFAFFTPLRVGGFAVALAALLMVIGLNNQWQFAHLGSNPLPERDALRSATVRGISPQGDIESFPGQIQWEAVSGAAAYQVTVSEVDGNVIFHKTFTSTRLQTPEEVNKVVVPGKTILLQIDAEDASGRSVAKSGAIRIRVRPSPPQAH